MTYKYKQFQPGFIRPIIPVTLHFNSKSVRFEALVDSGADMCMFPSALCPILGIDYKSGRKDDFFGATGIKASVYYHNISLEIGGFNVLCEAGFSDTQFPHGFLGQKGFFNKFIVSFHHRKGTIDLTPEPEVN